MRSAIPHALVATAASTLLISAAVYGDDAPASRPAESSVAAPMRPGRLLEAYGETLAGLNLSADQNGRVRTAIRAARESFRDRFADPNAAPAERASAVRQALAQLDQSIGDILTPQQREQFAERSATLRSRVADQIRQESRRPATTKPATQPAYEQRPGAPTAGRVERAIVGVGLTDEQRNAIFDVLDPARDEIDAMVAEATMNNIPQERVDRRVRELVEASYHRVAKLMVRDQRDRFEAQFRADRVTNLPPLRTPPAGSIVLRDGVAYLNGNAVQPDMMSEMRPGDAMMMGPATTGPNAMRPDVPRVAAGGGRAGEPATRPAATIKLGDPMPAFTLTRLNGSEVTQRIFAGKATVLIFGSLTAPSFRDRIAKFDQLSSRTPGVMWAVIYTREMYPGVGADADLPERNRDDKVAVAQHATLADRSAAARLAKRQLGIGFEVIPDSMDDTLTNTFGAFPNGAAVFDASGKLIALDNWAEPFAVKRTLDKLK